MLCLWSLRQHTGLGVCGDPHRCDSADGVCAVALLRLFYGVCQMYVSKLTTNGAPARELAACKGTSKQAGTLHSVVRGAFGSFVVRREQWDKNWGPKKLICLIRDIDGPGMDGRVGGILSIRGPEVSPRPLMVG